jgi:phosphate-selective porin OprO/OprP
MLATTAKAETAADTSLDNEVEQYLAQNSGKWGEPATFRAFWKDGIHMESGDGNFTVHFRGRAYFDMDWRDNDSDFDQNPDGGKVGDNYIGFSSVRLGVDGTMYKNVVYKLEVDFVGGIDDDDEDAAGGRELALRDVYVGLQNIGQGGTLLFGYMKQDFSIGEMTSSRYTTFIARAGTVQAFAPRRNSGVQYFQNFAQDKVHIGAGMFQRTSGGDGSANGQGGWGFNFRVAGLAIDNADKDMLLEIGFSILWQNLRENSTTFAASPGTSLGPVGIGGIDAGPADDELRWGLELAFRMKAFHLQAEFYMADVSRKAGDDPSFSGWYVQVGWFITGESRAFDKKMMAWTRTAPKANFWTGEGGKGALEVAFRWDTVDLEDGVGTGGEQDTLAVGFNWYWNPNARMMFNYVYADINDGPQGTGKLNSFIVRWQFDF